MPPICEKPRILLQHAPAPLTTVLFVLCSPGLQHREDSTLNLSLFAYSEKVNEVACWVAQGEIARERLEGILSAKEEHCIAFLQEILCTCCPSVATTITDK